MGLDILVGSKAIAGHEFEFRKLFGVLFDRPLPDSEECRSGLFNSLRKVLGLGGPSREQAVKRFQEISTPPYAAIGAPVVGVDQLANEWLAVTFAKNELATEARTIEEAIAEMKGYFSLEAMEDCDGFPVYTHAYMGEGIDRTSFRGKFLEFCTLADPTLYEQAFFAMLPEELSAWASKLRQEADQLADKHGVHHVLGDKKFQSDDESSPEAQVHILDQCARWAKFWSDRGHGTEPYY